ncbi:FAM172 family protein homolog CG10038-like [Bolinopsis microptera]|uniref:FAM172 family protein homolog CG10038-like n=1 Tax=Bolinopsis microptera TaxID=2820187 RepID=UPI00307B074B
MKYVFAIFGSIFSAIYLSSLLYSTMDDNKEETSIKEEDNKMSLLEVEEEENKMSYVEMEEEDNKMSFVEVEEKDKKLSLEEVDEENKKLSLEEVKEENKKLSLKEAETSVIVEKVGDTGFHFTESGEFLDEHDSKFQFAVSDDHSDNQSRYEQIGDAVTEYIYTVMEEKYGLRRIHIPIGIEEADPSSFVFVSNEFQSSANKKLVLINGSGAVKAGQWARSIIMNDNLYPGSMLPYIQWAADNEFDVLALNTNECGYEMNGSRTPFEHAQTVWDDMISGVLEKSVFIVTHSFGGVVVQKLIKNNSNFKDIVSKIAFTDSVHMGKIPCDSIPCINWVSSSKPVDKHLGDGFGCEMRSAGSTKHPWTSHYAMDYIFSWFMENETDEAKDENKL